MFLLDTNVISELRKAARGTADANFAKWAKRTDFNTCFLSVITIMELEMGLLAIVRKDQKKGEMLRSWYENIVLPKFQKKILDVDISVARCCAKLQVPDRKSERDVLIAATGIVHGMTVVTRNIKDFQATGVSLLNPWE